MALSLEISTHGGKEWFHWWKQLQYILHLIGPNDLAVLQKYFYKVVFSKSTKYILPNHGSVTYVGPNTSTVPNMKIVSLIVQTKQKFQKCWR
jgi:hypothetical protein